MRLETCISARYPRPLGVGLAILLAAIALAQPGHAADDEGPELWSEGGCAGCHGALAAGGDDLPGPNLRTMELDRDRLLEVIACGRPGTEMPYNFLSAYTMVGAYDMRPCYSFPVSSDPPVARGANFNFEQLGILVDFLMEHVVGVPITGENCAVFFGGNQDDPNCSEFD